MEETTGGLYSRQKMEIRNECGATTMQNFIFRYASVVEEALG